MPDEILQHLKENGEGFFLIIQSQFTVDRIVVE